VRFGGVVSGPELSLIGAGVDKTIIQRVDPKCRVVVNAWITGSVKPRRVSDLTIDCNATLRGPDAPSGIAALDWTDSLVERVKVIGLGSFDPKASPSDHPVQLHALCDSELCC